MRDRYFIFAPISTFIPLISKEMIRLNIQLKLSKKRYGLEQTRHT